MGWTKFVSLELDDDDRLDMAMPAIPQGPQFHPGQRISFDERILTKLGIKEMPEKDDLLDIRGFARVTFVGDGDQGRRLECQFEIMAIEDESQEDPAEEAEEEEEFEPSPPPVPEPSVTHEPPPVVKSGQRFGRSYAKARRPFIFHTDRE
jgi:hypothetical protein